MDDAYMLTLPDSLYPGSLVPDRPEMDDKNQKSARPVITSGLPIYRRE
jgi:hypothetical protein